VILKYAALILMTMERSKIHAGDGEGRSYPSEKVQQREKPEFFRILLSQ
jgi:hypothetical protein